MDLIGVIVALASEGAVFRKAWGIKSLEQEGPFRCYGDEERMLVIGGVGKVKCAAAVAWLLARYPDIQKGVLINAGIAGCKRQKNGTVQLIHQVVDTATDKRFYPDILFSHPYGEATLHTVDRPVASPVEEMAETDLIDMEGAAFLQTAQLWMSCHHTHLVKVVSDNLNPDRIDGNTVKDLMENTLPAVEHIIEAIPREPGNVTERMEVFAEIGAQWRLTASQRAQLDRAGRAWLLRHPDGVFASPDNVKVPRDKQMRNQSLKVLLDRLWEG